MEKQNKNSKVENVLDLIKQTDKENPKPEDLTALQKFLDKDSLLVELNSVSKMAFQKAIEIYSTSALLREVHKRDIEQKQKDLGYEYASPIEKILIDQVVLCWFRLNHIEIIHARQQAESHTFTSGVYWDKKLSSAQRRLLKAMETLAKVQKHLAEANLREHQAKLSQRKATILTKNLMKNLSN